MIYKYEVILGSSYIIPCDRSNEGIPKVRIITFELEGNKMGKQYLGVSMVYG